jgi:polyprenyldihydroxybenzoate methyltransferase/3-demethylubiquinol 3-O-methyltransferase
MRRTGEGMRPLAHSSSVFTCVQPGGHLFLSTMSRTPLAYALTIFAAERVLKMVSPGTHTYSKYIKPSEMLSFFQNHSSTEDARPWVTRLYNGLPSRQEAETRGLIYVPWEGQWKLTPRAGSALESNISTQCNYMFWVRKPKE